MKNYRQRGLFQQLSLGDSHVSRCQKQAQENSQALWEAVLNYGMKCSGLSKMLNLHGCLGKMYQPYEVRGLHWSYKISARSGICVNFILFPLPSLEVHNIGQDFGSLRVATPTTFLSRGPDFEILVKIIRIDISIFSTMSLFLKKY